MIEIATGAIQKVKEELVDMPEDANRLIHFLHNKNRYELHELDIEDRTETTKEGPFQEKPNAKLGRKVPEHASIH